MRKSKNKKSRNKKRTNKLQKRQVGGYNNDDETNCIYVSSHGIMKGVNKIKNIYYLKSDQLESFNIPEHRFILVTGNEDTTIPDDFSKKSDEILNSPNLIHWYAQNLIKHDNSKLTAIPIGLDYHTIAENKAGYEWWGEKQTPKEQEKFLLNLEKKPFGEREQKIYCNFLQSIRGKYGEKDRKEALEQIPADLLIKEEPQIARNKTWSNMIKYAFVLSPHGNGLDCHRTWEALVLGCIPIVKKSAIDGLYEDLPVLIVNNWSDINKELLDSTIQSFKNRQLNYEKLKLSYWIDMIYNSSTIKSGGDNLKTVIAICSNKDYLDKAELTINGLRTIGQYTGDIVFFSDETLNNDSKLNELALKHNVILKTFPKIDTSKIEQKLNSKAESKFKRLRNKMFQYHKFYVFDVYFKKWDRVLYVDSGMHIINPIHRILNLDTKNAILAQSDPYPKNYGIWKLNSQFNMELNNSVSKNFNLSKDDYFQSGLLYFDTNIIKDDTVQILIDLMNKYPVSNGDQGIMNLYFLNLHNLWKVLPIKNNSGFLYAYSEVNDNKKNQYIMLKYPKT